MKRQILAIVTSLAIAQTPGMAQAPKSAVMIAADDLSVGPYPSTYVAAPSGDYAIVGATILTAAGPAIENGTVLVSQNRIKAVGSSLPVPAGMRVIDGKGRWITPGIIDAHTHLGGVSVPFRTLRDPYNEITAPNTAQLFVENSVWPQSPDWSRIRAAGVSTVQVLPGSGNIFGGRSVVLKTVPAVTTAAMKFPGAPYGIKAACGENPSRVYGPRGQSPMTRAGVIAMMRGDLAAARDYQAKWRSYSEKIRLGRKADAPGRDMKLDALVGLIDGSIKLNVHCYRAEDMANVMGTVREFGFSVASFHHATEAFKIVPELKAAGPCILTWGGPDWGAFKMEAYDHSALQVAILDKAGICVAVTSDSKETGQHLNIDAARSMAAGNRAGLALTAADAIKWLTINPARALGIAGVTGSLEVGKAADIAMWDRDPFSSYAKVVALMIDGVEMLDGDAGSDFDVGHIYLGTK